MITVCIDWAFNITSCRIIDIVSSRTIIALILDENFKRRADNQTKYFYYFYTLLRFAILSDCITI